MRSSYEYMNYLQVVQVFRRTPGMPILTGHGAAVCDHLFLKVFLAVNPFLQPSSNTHRREQSMGRKGFTQIVFLRLKIPFKVYSFHMLVSRHMLSTTAVTFRGSELPRGYFHSVTPP